MYEVQIADDDIFSSFETFEVLEPFLALENIITRKYVRVRGVLFGGLAGNFSSTVVLNPIITAPTAISVAFYSGYNTAEAPENSLPEIGKSIHYGGQKIPGFYTLIDHTFYAKRSIGGLNLWGYVGCRLKQFRDSNIMPWDRVRFTVNGLNVFEQQFAHWTAPFYPEETVTSFYARGGYTAAFGPYLVTYPANARSSGPLDPRSAFGFYAINSGGNDWNFPRNVFRPARLDQGDVSELRTVRVTDGVSAEAFVDNVPQVEPTTLLKCRDFNFNVPADANIEGIEVQVKRRQLDETIDRIGDDLGKAPSLHNVLTNAQNITTDDIVSIDSDTQPNISVDFTASIDYNGVDQILNGPSRVSPQGLPLDMNTGDLSISIWLLPRTGAFLGRKVIFNAEGGTGAPGLRLQNFAASGPNPQKFTVDVLQTSPVILKVHEWDSLLTANILDHIAVTYSSSTNTLTLYKNGVIVPATVTDPDNPVFNQNGNVDVEIGARLGAPVTFVWDGTIGQIGLWDKILDQDEIVEIAGSSNKIDLRFDKGDYTSSDRLRHYWLHLFNDPDIRDFRISLVDENDNLLDENKAITTESWPKLTTFNADGTADGIPHEHPIGIGYQEYGGVRDTWEQAKWTAEQVNSPNFGVAIGARNERDSSTGSAYIDHVRMSVHWTDFYASLVRVRVEAEAVNEFYIERELFGGLLNAIELGEKL
jgi:hypothetical protein